MDNFKTRAIFEVPVVVLDTETTGLSPAFGHRIIEIAAIRLEKGQEVARIDQLVNPGRPIDPGASRVNGIYDHHVAGAPPFEHVAAPLLDVIDGALIVAHNAQFDAMFLGMEYGILDTRHTLYNPWLCTLQLAQRLFSFRRNSLAQVARNFGVVTNGSHRALHDVNTTVNIFKQMTRALKRRHLHTVEDYFRAQGGPIYVPSNNSTMLPPVMRQALAQRQLLRIRYRTKDYETERVIKPLYPAQRDGNVYVVAYCQLRQSQRTFRLDRIVSVELLNHETES